MTCIDCDDTRAHDDWEFIEGAALCCDCAKVRLEDVPQPLGYEKVR